MKHYLIPLLLSLSISGCALFSDKDETEPPAELQDFQAKVQLDTLWSRKLGVGSDEQFVRYMPAILGERVFVADRKGKVWALAADSGEELWEVNTKARISAAAGVGEGLVLLGTSEAEVLALSTSDGSVQWRTSVASEVMSVPRVERGTVAVQTVDGTLSGLRVSDGERQWVYDRTVPALTLRGTSTPVAGGGVFIAGFANGRLAALIAEKGQVAWEIAVAEPRGRSELERMVDLDADPMVMGNTVYAVTFQGRVAAIDIPSGQIEWARELSSFTSLGLDYNNLYITDDHSDLWALNRRSGASVWKQDALHLRGLSAPVALEDYVAVGDYAGYVHLLSRFDGEIVARMRTDSKGIAALQVVGERLFVLGKGGNLTVLKIHSDR